MWWNRSKNRWKQEFWQRKSQYLRVHTDARAVVEALIDERFHSRCGNICRICTIILLQRYYGIFQAGNGAA